MRADHYLAFVASGPARPLTKTPGRKEGGRLPFKLSLTTLRNRIIETDTSEASKRVSIFSRLSAAG